MTRHQQVDLGCAGPAAEPQRRPRAALPCQPGRPQQQGRTDGNETTEQLYENLDRLDHAGQPVENVHLAADHMAAGQQHPQPWHETGGREPHCPDTRDKLAPSDPAGDKKPEGEREQPRQHERTDEVQIVQRDAT